jgi:hypothetical protein
LQRFLYELINSGLIEKAKRFIKGKTRNIYRFLTNSLSADRHDKLSPRPQPAGKVLPPGPSDCRERHDKSSPSLIRNETDKEEYTPPTPQALGLEPSQAADPEVGCGGDSVWLQVKERLLADISPGNFKTWVAPLRFERRDQKTVVLLAPNPFFLSWVQQHYSTEISQAFQDVGIEVRLEVDLTPKEEKPHPSVQAAATRPTPAQEVDWEALTVEDQFEKIYAAYPRKEKFWDGLRAFKRLVKQGECSARLLIKAIFRQKNTDSWNREDGRFVPQFHNWLLGKRWMD